MTTPTQIDWDADVATTPAEEYAALVRSLRWTADFGLFFVRCSPAKGQELISDLQQDLPEKRFAVITLEERTDNLYELIAALPHREQLDIVIVSGLDASLVDYIKPGYGGHGEHYKLDSVPRILGSLNLQRERFRDELKLCVVFFVPLFGLKYFIHRAPDFYDWRSGTFEFFDKDEELKIKVDRALEERQTLEQYAALLPAERRQKFVEIQELLDGGSHSPERAANLWFESALLLDMSGEHESALPFYDLALAAQPQKAEAWYNRGIALYELGRYEEAIVDYKQAIEVQPDKFDAWHARGIALRKLGQYQEAIENYDHAIRLNLDFYVAWYDRGLAFAALGNYPNALESFSKALEISDDYGPALYNSACTYALLGNSEAALDMLKRAMVVDRSKYLVMASKDSDLDSLRSYPEFKKLLE